jgi:hypothetical protein
MHFRQWPRHTLYLDQNRNDRTSRERKLPVPCDMQDTRNGPRVRRQRDKGVLVVSEDVLE